jgi:Skp family chaperone for outer membrane proteins
MQAMSTRIFLILFIIIFIYPSSMIAGAEKRTALVIGNGGYSSSPLKNAVNDAADIAANLQRLGFSVILKKNVSHQEMEDTILEFGEQLKKGGVGLFFYAGHGVQKDNRNYLIPIGAKINKDTDIKFQAVDAEMVLAEMGNAGNNLNIVILDACRDNPFSNSFRTSSRGLAIISDAPKGTFITYSTSPGKVAADGSGRNSPYTESLIKYMNTKGLPIEEVFKEVRKDLGKKTGGQQVPWELSSLEGQFYFLPGTAKTVTGKVESTVSSPTDELDDENRKLEAEQRRLEYEKASFAKQKALEEKRQNIADEKQRLEAEKEEARQAALERNKAKKTTTLAMAKRPSSEETGRDGRFIAYSNGTVLDTKTNLMWAANDNGFDISRRDAKSYCENYRGGGYSDWRMPEMIELGGLYDAGKNQRNEAYPEYQLHLTELIDITACCPWVSEPRGSDIAYEAAFNFSSGSWNWIPQSQGSNRALPVRSVK